MSRWQNGQHVPVFRKKVPSVGIRRNAVGGLEASCRPAEGDEKRRSDGWMVDQDITSSISSPNQVDLRLARVFSGLAAPYKAHWSYAMPICEECGARRPQAVEGPQTVTELYEEMDQVDALMKRLAVHRSGLRRRINSLVPISRLPPEVLTDIFSLVCQTSTSTTPIFLGSICADWRSLAWNTPLLWCQITLEVSHTLPKSRPHLLSEWLSRANGLPLHIKLFTAEEDDAVFLNLRAIMEVLVTRSACWSSVECILPPHCHDLLSVQRFPVLRSVLLRPPKGTISTFSQPPDMFGEGCTPVLEDVYLTGYDFSSMKLPWTQLRKFRTQFLTVAECVKVLQQCPNLKECYLDNVYCPDHYQQSQQHQLVHETLEVLEVTFIKGAATSSFLDAISLPALKDLGLHYLGTENVPLLPVISLVSRSACKLRKLSITRTAFAEEDLIRCLDVLPSLEELCLCVRQVVHSIFGGGMKEGLSERFVRRLFLDSSLDISDIADSESHRNEHRFHEPAGTVLLPNLRKFTIEGAVNCPVEVLVSMLEWRWRRSQDKRRAARLESFENPSTGRRSWVMKEEYRKALSGLKGEGMRISLRL